MIVVAKAKLPDRAAEAPSTRAVSMPRPFGGESRALPDEQQPGGLCTVDASTEKILSKAPQWLLPDSSSGTQLWFM